MFTSSNFLGWTIWSRSRAPSAYTEAVVLYHHSVHNTCASLPYRFVWNILRACSSPCSSLCKAHVYCGINRIHQCNLPTQNCWEWGDTLWLSQWEIHFEEEICGQSLWPFAKPKNPSSYRYQVHPNHTAQISLPMDTMPWKHLVCSNMPDALVLAPRE